MTNLEHEYINKGGATCPACGSCSISSDNISADGTTAWADVECLACKATWTDLYNLVGFQDLTTSKETT